MILYLKELAEKLGVNLVIISIVIVGWLTALWLPRQSMERRVDDRNS